MMAKFIKKGYVSLIVVSQLVKTSGTRIENKGRTENYVIQIEEK